MRTSLRVILKRSFFVLLLLSIGIYAYLQSQEFLRGPVVSVTNPRNGDTATEEMVVVEGEVENVAYITLNGRQIFADSEGVFREKLLLLPGYNIITIEAEDKFNRETTETIELVYPKTLATSSPVRIQATTTEN